MELAALKIEWLKDPAFAKEYAELEGSYEDAQKLIQEKVSSEGHAPQKIIKSRYLTLHKDSYD
jgi:hypothetical protein